MRCASTFSILILSACLPLAWCRGAEPTPADQVTFQQRDGGLQIAIGDQPIAEYVWNDAQTSRPYFRHLRTRSGVLVTRNHPPIKGEDIDDHPTMHPGLWMSFGDLSGADFWRNKGRVRHVEFLQKPMGGAGSGSFIARNSYENDEKVICTEECRISISTRSEGYLLNWDSKFRSGQGPFTFGDQEEMGLGVRVATPLAVVKGGQIMDSEGRKNGDQVWGKQADWCEYGGLLKGHQVGIVLMPEPQNFRRSWFHARDYGLLVANPFGQKAFTKGETSQVVTPRDKDFRLRFNILVYQTKADGKPDLPAIYKEVTRNNR